MDIFKEEYSVDDKLVYKLYTAEVWAVSLGREVRVVIVDYLDADKKTQARKVFFSTDLTLSARDIFDIYRTRFQLEFVFRDAKQFTGLTHCQARSLQCILVFRQRCQGLCQATGAQPFRRFNQNPAAQRCNGGSIYCNVRETCELAIK